MIIRNFHLLFVKKRNAFLALCLFFAPMMLWAQAKQDSSKVVIELQQIYAQALQNHPVIKQALTFSQTARQELRMARGAFDPKLMSDLQNKQFLDKQYYQLWNSQLKVPTWFGVELKAGFEQNTGINLNPQNDSDKEKGLWYAGISIPLGQGLVIDQRRTALKQAKIMQHLAEAERLKMVNKLILDIAKDYWEWYFYYHNLRLAEQGFTMAQYRYRAVVERIKQGDLAPIDSVEAKITLEQREIDLTFARMHLKNAALILSTHLWNEKLEPLELSTDFAPSERLSPMLGESELEQLRTFALQNHPEMLKLRYKIEQLENERRLAAEMLKPSIYLNYNYLHQNSAKENFNTALLSQNYKFGAEFSFPLFIRKERAKLQMTKIKVEQIDFERTNFQRNLIADLQTHYNDLLNLLRALRIQEQMTANYEKLWSSEIQLFNNGESSVFYVNVREGKLLEAKAKLYEMRHKYEKALAELRWAAGTY